MLEHKYHGRTYRKTMCSTAENAREVQWARTVMHEVGFPLFASLSLEFLHVVQPLFCCPAQASYERHLPPPSFKGTDLWGRRRVTSRVHHSKCRNVHTLVCSSNTARKASSEHSPRPSVVFHDVPSHWGRSQNIPAPTQTHSTIASHSIAAADLCPTSAAVSYHQQKTRQCLSSPVIDPFSLTRSTPWRSPLY
jgi:hypothetical protein